MGWAFSYDNFLKKIFVLSCMIVEQNNNLSQFKALAANSRLLLPTNPNWRQQGRFQVYLNKKLIIFDLFFYFFKNIKYN